MSKQNLTSYDLSSSSSEEDNNYTGSLDPKEILSNIRQQLAEKNKKLLEKKQAVNFYEGDSGVLNISEMKPAIFNPPEIKPNLNMLLGKVAPAQVAGGSASAADGGSASGKGNKVAPAPVVGGRASSILTGMYPASEHDYIRNLLEIENLTPEGILKKYRKQTLDKAIRLIEQRQKNPIKKLIPFHLVWP